MKYTKVDSVCTYCGVGCEISASLESGKIVKISPMVGGISNGGKICIKGKVGYEFLYSNNRLTKHLIKKSFLASNKNLFDTLDISQLQDENSDYYSAPLQLACDIASIKLLELRKNFGANALGFIGGARTSCESAWAFQKFARTIIGSPHIDNCARVCHSPTLAGLKNAIGEGAATNPFDDILEAEFLLVIGSNTTEAHPIVANRILDAVKHGSTLAVVDIREIQLSKKANFHLTIPPEANLLFLNAIARVIIEEKLYDKEFIAKRVNNFAQYKKEILHDETNHPSIFLKMHGYEKLASQIKEIARIYAKSKSMILWGLGVTEHLDGSKTVQAIANLALLTGNIGKIGAGLMPLRGQNNVQGACDVGCLPYYAPSYQKPLEEGLKTPHMLDAMLNGTMKSLWVMGEDISHIHANLNKVDSALARLDFLVVQEVMNADIVKRADIIFAVKSGYEKTGVYVNAERRLHLSHPIITSDLPDDWEVLNIASKKFDVCFDYHASMDVWDDVRKDTQIYSGASYEKLSKTAMQWPISDTQTIRLYEERFRTADGLGVLEYSAYEMKNFVKALLDGNKPHLTLSTGRIIAQYNNASQTKESDKLCEHYPQEVVFVNHETAKTLDLTKKYILKSKHGSTNALSIKEDKRLPANVLFTTFHFSQSQINRLFGDEADSKTLTPRFKAIEVEIINDKGKTDARDTK